MSSIYYDYGMKVLIIDDDSELTEFLHSAFIHEGWQCDTAFDGQKGSFMARSNSYDCILLDYNIPKRKGDIVCAEIRDNGKQTPIMVISSIDDTPTKVQLLNLGADDYITKPLNYAEIVARIKALIRRPPSLLHDIVHIGGLTIDIARQNVLYNDKGLYLTKKEYSLLEYLVRNRGIVMSRGMIMDHVWNSESDPFSNTIEAHIRNLRKKLAEAGAVDIIKNIPGRGYSIDYEF